LEKKRGLSQEEIAQKCQISLRQYSNIERGKSTPLVTTANKICKMLGITTLQVAEWIPPSIFIFEFIEHFHILVCN